jgi:hypothetical protein
MSIAELVCVVGFASGQTLVMVAAGVAAMTSSAGMCSSWTCLRSTLRSPFFCMCVKALGGPASLGGDNMVEMTRLYCRSSSPLAEPAYKAWAPGVSLLGIGRNLRGWNVSTESSGRRRQSETTLGTARGPGIVSADMTVIEDARGKGPPEKGSGPSAGQGRANFISSPEIRISSPSQCRSLPIISCQKMAMRILRALPYARGELSQALEKAHKSGQGTDVQFPSSGTLKTAILKSGPCRHAFRVSNEWLNFSSDLVIGKNTMRNRVQELFLL